MPEVPADADCGMEPDGDVTVSVPEVAAKVRVELVSDECHGSPPAPERLCTPRAGSALDHPHLLLAVVVTGGRGEPVEAGELVGAELDGVGGHVLLHP